MNCNRFPEEYYAFHVLGRSEKSERQAINEHVREDCAVCTDALKEAADFWYVYGAATASLPELQTIAPNPALRRRIVNSIRPRGFRQFMIPTFTWTRYAAGGALAAGAMFCGWDVARTLSRKELSEQSTELSQQRARGEQLDAENRTLRNATPSQTARVETPMPAPQQIRVPIDDPRVPQLEQDLATTQASAAATAQALSDQQALVRQTEATLASRTAEVAAANRNLNDAEARYQAALRTSTRQSDLIAQRESELNAARRTVQDLQSQVVQFQRVMDMQRQTMDQHTKMVAMLQKPDVTLVQLQGTEAARRSSGIALIAGGSTVEFFATNLPALPPGRTYQLWLLRSRGPAIVSAGIFTRTPADAPTIQFESSQLTRDITGIAVSEEPAGGSAMPTGHKLMVGTKKG